MPWRAIASAVRVGLDGDIGAASVGDLEPSGPSLGSAHGTVTSFSATTSQLREEKSQLKQRLRAFDVDFKAKHGRLVSKPGAVSS